MNTRPRTWLTMLFIAISTLLTASASNKDEEKMVRVVRNRDGSISEFERNPQNTVLEKRTYNEKPNGEKTIHCRTIYRRDTYGNLRSGAIFDGQRKQLYRIVYGYHKNSGLLIAENMFDVRVKRTDPKDPSKEIPLRAVRYFYDAQGRRSKPQIFTSAHGKDAEELLRWLDRNKMGESTIDDDPYRHVPVNPNAKPVGQ